MMRFRSSTTTKALQPTVAAGFSPKPTKAKAAPTSSVLLGNGDKNVEFQKEQIRFSYPDNWKLDQIDSRDGSVSISTPKNGKLRVYYKGIPKSGIKRECQENRQEEKKEINGKLGGSEVLNTCIALAVQNDANLVFNGNDGGKNVTVVYEFPKSDSDGAKKEFEQIIKTIDTGTNGNTSPSPTLTPIKNLISSPTVILNGNPISSPTENPDGNITPSPTGSPGGDDNNGIIPDCSNDVLGLTVKAPFPSDSWFCLSKHESDQEGWIDVKSDLFTIRLSNLFRGPFCGSSTSNMKDCTVSPFYSNKITDLYMYNFKGEDKEIFGILNYKFQRSNQKKIWQSIIYQNMETRRLTQNEKDELTKVLDAIMQLSQ